MVAPDGTPLLRNSLQPLLKPGEEVMAADFWVSSRGSEGAQAAPGVVLANRMGVAVTSQRLLVCSLQKWKRDEAQDVLTDLPLTQVDSIATRSPHWYAQVQVVLTVGGVEHLATTTDTSRTKKLAAALDAAKQKA